VDPKRWPTLNISQTALSSSNIRNRNRSRDRVVKSRHSYPLVYIAWGAFPPFVEYQLSTSICYLALGRNVSGIDQVLRR
jgi:hypothetical protein